MTAPSHVVIDVHVPLTVDVEAVAAAVDIIAPDPDGALVIVVPQPGPPGPQGPAGDGGVTHTQSTAAATWTITHSLGRYPASVLVVVDDAQVDTDVEFPDLTTVVVTFASPQSGRVEII